MSKIELSKEDQEFLDQAKEMENRMTVDIVKYLKTTDLNDLMTEELTKDIIKNVANIINSAELEDK